MDFLRFGIGKIHGSLVLGSMLPGGKWPSSAYLAASSALIHQFSLIILPEIEGNLSTISGMSK